MKLFIFATLCVAFVGCTAATPVAPAAPPAPGASATPTPAPAGNPIACSIQDTVASLAAVAIAQQINCTGIAAITATIESAASGLGFCPATAALQAKKLKAAHPALKTSIFDTICTDLGSAVVVVAGSQIPAAWACTTGAQILSLSTTIHAACVKAFP